MDYEEKYEQAMFRMNKWAEGSEITDPKEVAEFVFPELKESKDEKIRAGIIKYLEQSQFGEEHYQVDDDIVRGYIAWLEKQDEQKPADIPEDFEKLVEHLLSLSDGEGHGSPAKVKEVSAELLRLANQQKPAWSEEDEKYIASIIKMVEHCSFSSIGGITKAAALAWLKSLKERMKGETK